MTDTGTSLDISVICAPAYWQFLLTEKHVVISILPSNCDAKKRFWVAYISYHMNLPFNVCGVKPYNGNKKISHKDKLEEVLEGDKPEIFTKPESKKTSASVYQICGKFEKLVVQHASMAKQMKSVLGSGLLSVVERKMMLIARSTRIYHHIIGKRQQFQRKNMVVNCFSV